MKTFQTDLLTHFPLMLVSHAVNHLLPVGLVSNVAGILGAAGQRRFPLPVIWAVNSTALKLERGGVNVATGTTVEAAAFKLPNTTDIQSKF